MCCDHFLHPSWQLLAFMFLLFPSENISQCNSKNLHSAVEFWKRGLLVDLSLISHWSQGNLHLADQLWVSVNILTRVKKVKFSAWVHIKMPATSVKEYISPNNLVPFNFSPHIPSIFPNLSCLVFKPYFFSVLPHNVIFYTRCFAHYKAVRSVTCSNCTAVAELDQESLSFCSGSDGGESSCNFRHRIALILIAPVEHKKLHLPHRAILED